VKGVFLLGILASSGMTLETRARPEGIAQVGGLLERTHKIRYSVACCQGLDDHFIGDGGTDMAINAFDVLLTFDVVSCGQSNPLTLYWMELGKFFFVQMASRAERIVLFQVVRDHDAPPKRCRAEEGEPHQEER
jgi:hypothetical protein